MRTTRRQFTIAAASLLALGSAGCAGTPKESDTNKSLIDRLPWTSAADEEEQPVPYPNPVKIAATWTPDSLVQSGRTPTRGFGGRLFFYDEKSRPVPVEGTLTVHGFDDTATSQDDAVKRFKFTPEQFTRHFSQTDLGASYSIWIPWDAVGGEQKKISMITSFKTVEGKTVQGAPATIVLPGHQTDIAAADPTAKYSPQYKRYLQAQNSLNSNRSGLTTTTIARQRPGSAASPSANPGISIPQLSKESSVASKTQTPSLELKRAYRGPGSRIRPASAQLPIKKGQ